jgi:hypothetical protein
MNTTLSFSISASVMNWPMPSDLRASNSSSRAERRLAATTQEVVPTGWEAVYPETAVRAGDHLDARADDRGDGVGERLEARVGDDTVDDSARGVRLRSSRRRRRSEHQERGDVAAATELPAIRAIVPRESDCCRCS